MSIRTPSWLLPLCGAICFVILLVAASTWRTWADGCDTEVEEAPVATPPDKENKNVAPTPTPAPDPTGCLFIDGSRPQVGEKYVVTCDEGIFLATADYTPGGVITFSAFTTTSPMP